jgi:hypothetical protein
MKLKLIMDISRGNIFYNQVIPEDELWEDTLKRNGLKIIQLHKPSQSIYGEKLNVCIMEVKEVKEGELVIVENGDKTIDEIKTLLKESSISKQ